MEAGPLNLVRPEVPVELAAVVAKMMAKEPGRRFQTPGEVAQVWLRHALTGREEKEGTRLPVADGSGVGVRLPGGESGDYGFGDDASKLDLYAWHGGIPGAKHTAWVQKRPNGFGLFDMHGNVQEWCTDWYNGVYYQESRGVDPVGPFGLGATSRVNRGGGFRNEPRLVRSASRHRIGRESGATGWASAWPWPSPILHSLSGIGRRTALAGADQRAEVPTQSPWPRPTPSYRSNGVSGSLRR